MVPYLTVSSVRDKVRPTLQGNHRIIPRRSLLARFLRSLCTYDAATNSIQVGAVTNRKYQVQLCLINSK